MAPITSVSGSLGSSNSTTPFEGFTRMIQHRVDRLGNFVDTYSPLPIEWLLIVLPFVIGILRVVTPMMRQTATETYQRMQRVVIRDITAVFVNGYMINGIPTDRNALLQNAVLMYLQRHVWSRKPLPASAWRNKTAVVLLIDPFRSRVNEYSSSPFNVTEAQSSDSDDDRDMAMRGVARSKKFMDRLLLAKLPLGTWVKADEVSGIEISFRRCLTKYGKSAASERTLSLMARGRDASQRIDQFTQKSLSYFLTQLPQLTKSDRFFFELQPSADGGLRDDKKSLVFKRYVLSADKNLDTLFFPERNNMVKLIDDFVFRRGRFAVEGFPYKLGVLLHGPHGAGKTAFVKALAAYTGRHVVSVPLGLVETNQQLYDIFLTRNYTCVGESESQRLKLEEVIFLFDDVDAASPLVCSRQRRRKVYRRPDAVLRSSGRIMPDLYGAEECNHADLLPALDLEADGSDIEDDAEEVLEEQVVELTERVPVLASAISSDFLSGGTSTQPTTTSAVSAGSAPLTASALDGKKSLLGMFESADKLDLSGLLNVLDGVVDTPGRIVVMVTNHPERLDPALVRPGRMSSRLRLDYIRFDAVLKMAGLHFGEREPPALTAEEILDRLEDRVLSEAARRRDGGQNGSSGTATPGWAPAKSVADKAAAKEEASRLNDDDDDDDDDEDTVENTISIGKDKTATKTTTKDAAESSDAATTTLIRGSTQNAMSVPMGMAAARVPHKSLSDDQVKRLREAIAKIEREAEAAKAKSCDSAEGAMPSSAFRLKIAPSEVELLCSQTETLEEFIQALQSLMRGQLKL